jgi:3-oxoacyl-[acyl-carrier protein] reductase
LTKGHRITMRLQGRKAVVTGGSSGIGRAVALALAREGAHVVINYRKSREAAESCMREIEARGGRAMACQADVALAGDISLLLEAAVAELGGIDLWVNMAGADILTGEGARLPDHEKLALLLDTDLRGTILASWAAAEVLSSQPGGCLINTSWDQALRGMGGRNPEMFAAVKAGITGFTRALARSLAPRVRVNEVAPGWIETAFAEREMRADYRAAVVSATPLQRFGYPEDVAEAVVFLASPEASFITGQTLKVNGGLVS